MHCSSWRCSVGGAAARAVSVGPRAAETGLKLTGDLQEETHNLQEWSNLQLETRIYKGYLWETIHTVFYRCTTNSKWGIILSVMNNKIPHKHHLLSAAVSVGKYTILLLYYLCSSTHMQTPPSLAFNNVPKKLQNSGSDKFKCLKEAVWEQWRWWETGGYTPWVGELLIPLLWE